MCSMKIIVQKFGGGTSISSKESREKASNKIIENTIWEYKIVVVVSAMGRKGDPYATDTLLNIINPKMVTNKEIDMLLSCGEIISSVVLASLLYEKVIKWLFYLDSRQEFSPTVILEMLKSQMQMHQNS